MSLTHLAQGIGLCIIVFTVVKVAADAWKNYKLNSERAEADEAKLKQLAKR